MRVEAVQLGHIHTNCYMLLSETAAVVVDPGFYDERVARFLADNKDKSCAILITHAHFDHMGAAAQLREETGAPIIIGETEQPALSNSRLNLSDRFKPEIAPFTADETLVDNECFSVGDIDFRAMLTPGHTIGSMCYLTADKLFSGDTLFRETAGRTDLPGGSITELIASLYRLMEECADTVIVYPGHGEITDIGHERRYNPFLRLKYENL